MELDVNDVLARYAAEVAQLTQRAIVAEARADALAAQVEGAGE